MVQTGFESFSIVSEQFEFIHEQTANLFIEMVIDAGQGDDFAFFQIANERSIEASGSELVLGETITTSGIQVRNFESTFTQFVDGSPAGLTIAANATPGPVRVVASPTSMVFSGDGFNHRFFDFSFAIVQSFRPCRNSTAKPYGPGGIDAVYNARQDSTLVDGDFSATCFPFMGTSSGSITGRQFETDRSLVRFTHEQALRGFSLPPGGVTNTSEGFDTLRVINLSN